MLQVANFSAWINIEGSESTQHSVMNNGSEASCWIASEVGKNFSVRWKFGEISCSIRSSVYADGQNCSNLVWERPNPTNEHQLEAIRTSGTFERPLMFSPTDVTDDDEYLATTDPRTGEIKLEFYEYEVTGRQPRGHRRNYEFTGPAKVHERSKKALGHQVGLGEERTSTHKESLHDICGHDKSKLATFLFRYRPIDFLRANGTAPPAPPSNTSSSQKRPVPVEDIIAISDSDDPQDEDLQALQEVEAQLLAVRQQLRNKRRKITKVKSESNVKMEPGLVKREKTDVQLDGEVIDLT